MTPRIKRLEQVLMIRSQGILSAEKRLADARSLFQQYQIQHNQLILYRQEYMERLNEMGQDGCFLANIRNRVNFVGQLDRALSHMNDELAKLSKARLEAEKDYLNAKREEEVLSRLIKRIEQDENMKENAKEQKESDEQSQKQWYSNHISQSS